MSIYDINSFPGSDNLESKLPGVSFVGSDKLTEPTRAGIEEERTTMTRGQKAAATRKKNAEIKAAKKLAVQQEEDLLVVEAPVGGISILSEAPGSVMAYSWHTGEADPSGIDQHTAGAKLDSGKVDMAMIMGCFPRSLFAVGSLGIFGANKYSMGGFLEVENAVHRYQSAGLRHMMKHMQDEIIDNETKMLHLAAVAWNSMAALEIYCRDNGYTGEFRVIDGEVVQETKA